MVHLFDISRYSNALFSEPQQDAGDSLKEVRTSEELTVQRGSPVAGCGIEHDSDLARLVRVRYGVVRQEPALVFCPVHFIWSELPSVSFV